ncbi:glycosyltransferase [Pelagicoccus sp. SDUM812003]|uniref:glycosyltransferase n=1 Tax=Pelagicoccus sp. SDUM812003 TaxID=3041267 RepID=UPI00280C4935|nr:glycosyltransferase [Pelagicoccus sp. SDUM812003]MDQ8202147.1 glycosyltransferase [Pelagicoccus sp. SDUM812003]
MSGIRILVLTSSTGGGHDARATAFRRWVRELYGWEVDVRVESMLEDSSRVARFGVHFYNFIQRHAPWLHHPYYLLVEGMSFLNKTRVTLGRRYYTEVIESYRPHLVFSVHDCLNRGYFQEARRILGKHVRCATYCSEFSGGYGYSRNWVEPTVDLYISRTATARDFAVKALKLDPSRIEVRGQFLMPRVYRETLSPIERHRFITERLGLRSDRKIVFLTTGGAGANNHIAILEVLKRHADQYQAVVVCGRNQKVFLQVTRWSHENPDFRCNITGYTNEIHLYMQAADFVITRGGTTTCAEALHFECPIVFNGFGGVMPQEKLTVKYFLQDDAAEMIAKTQDLEKLLGDWYRSPDKFRDLKKRFSKMRFMDDPRDTVRLLVELAREGTGAQERPVLKVVGE